MAALLPRRQHIERRPGTGREMTRRVFAIRLPSPATLFGGKKGASTKARRSQTRGDAIESMVDIDSYFKPAQATTPAPAALDAPVASASAAVATPLSSAAVDPPVASCSRDAPAAGAPTPHSLAAFRRKSKIPRTPADCQRPAEEPRSGEVEALDEMADEHEDMPDQYDEAVEEEEVQQQQPEPQQSPYGGEPAQGAGSSRIAGAAAKRLSTHSMGCSPIASLCEEAADAEEAERAREEAVAAAVASAAEEAAREAREAAEEELEDERAALRQREEELEREKERLEERALQAEEELARLREEKEAALEAALVTAEAAEAARLARQQEQEQEHDFDDRDDGFGDHGDGFDEPDREDGAQDDAQDDAQDGAQDDAPPPPACPPPPLTAAMPPPPRRAPAARGGESKKRRNELDRLSMPPAVVERLAAQLGSLDQAGGRSRRQRFRPLEYWKGERVVYGRRASAKFEAVVDVLVAAPEPEPAPKARKTAAKAAGKTTGKTAEAEVVERRAPELREAPSVVVSGGESGDEDGGLTDAEEREAARKRAASYRIAGKKKAQKA
jgi:hypothetical protein